jgi:hypothetical protein
VYQKTSPLGVTHKPRARITTAGNNNWKNCEIEWDSCGCLGDGPKQRIGYGDAPAASNAARAGGVDAWSP